MVVIDPVFNATAAKADKYIPINPSTDGALALAIINKIITEGKEDAEFVSMHTELPFIIKEDGSFLRMSELTGEQPAEGEEDPIAVWDDAIQDCVAYTEAVSPAYKGVTSVNGINVCTAWDVVAQRAAEWPAKRASEVTGVSEEDIDFLVGLYTENDRVSTYSCLGADHYLNGIYNYWPMLAVSIITGNVGKKGATLIGACNTPQMAINLINGVPVDSQGNPGQGAGASYPVNQMNAVLDSGAYAGAEAIVNSLYVCYANPVAVAAERSKTVEWFNKLDFVVVTDIEMTETMKYADIVLPAAHWFEVEDVFTCCHNHPFFVMQEKAIEPQFESKPDFEIYLALADAMGYGDFFPDRTADDFLRSTFSGEGAEALGASLDRLKEEGAVRFVPEGEYIAYEGGNFRTNTGRARLYVEPASVYAEWNGGQDIDVSKEISLYWEPALEADKSSPIREKHPYHLISEHMRTRTHTQFYSAENLKDYDPEAIVRINPADAADLGIAEGDTVRLYNDRGEVTMRACISAGYPRGVVGSPRSYQAGEFLGGHYADLPTNQYNQVCANQASNDLAVSIEKA